MSGWGWMIMIVSVVTITVFFGGSLYLALTRQSGKLHSTFDEPPDLDKD